MKRQINTIIIVALTCFGLSCETYVEDLNIDPNNATDAPAEYILTGAQVTNMYNFHMDRMGIIASMWSGQLTGIDRQYLSYQNYQYSPVETSGNWTDLYQKVYIQLEISKKKFDIINNRLGTGIAKIIQSHSIGTAAAIYGDIPFSQAGAPEEYPNPVFDDQEDVYSNIQVLLSSGISDLESGIGSLPGGTDIYFDGDRVKWIEVAHTLKARFYLETGDYEQAYAEAEMGISALSNSLMSKHTPISGMRNGLYTHQVNDRVGDVNAMGSNLSMLLNPEDSTYRGNAKTDETARFNYYFVNLGDNGITGEIEPNYLSTSMGDSFNGFIAIDAAFPLVSYQENILILAEAAARVKGFDVALDHLNDFRSFMNNGGYMDATYIEEFPLKYDPYNIVDFQAAGINNQNGNSMEEALLTEILEERYVTFFMQIIAFNDVRRTRGETAGIKLQPETGDKLPERLFWGESDINSNVNPPPLPSIFDPTPINLH